MRTGEGLEGDGAPAATAAPPAPPADFRRRVISAVKWSAAGKFLGQMISWAVTFYVMRKLDPSVYGLMGMATVAISFLMVINELGLGATLVQRRNLDDRTKRQVFGFVLAMNTALFTVLVVSAPWIAAYFREPQVVPLIRALALQFLVMSFVVVPQSMLERELDFKRQSIIFLIASLAASATQIVLVHTGAGVWCLVWSNLVLVTVRAIGLNILHPFLKLPVLALRGAKDLFSYGGVVAGSRLLWMFYQRADIVIAGRLLGTTAVGLYQASMHYAMLPLEKMGMVVNQVTFPAFARIQDQPDLVRRHFLKAIRLLSFFAVPVLWGISAVSRESVALILGPKWDAIVTPLRLLSFAAPVSMISGLHPPLYQAIGRPSREFFDLVRSTVVMVPAFLIGCQWGLIGLTLAWVVVYPALVLFNMRVNYPLVGLRVRDTLAAVRTPLLAAAVMYVAVRLVGHLAADLPNPLLLALLVAVGTVTYPLVALRLSPDLRAEAMALLRR
ncbi:MAG: lipopolysaccharide biosynthesis protein [Planctomycetes bacterium]|nr:lipopolysaccharide biosynthesis protein [Planctomycetota bacterium]